MRRSIILLSLFIYQTVSAQKKPLDHSVYDGWQSIGEKMISRDGKWVVYTINPQEGDNELVIQSPDASYKKTIARGYGAVITDDSRFVIFKIKPFFKDLRDARIKKKKAEDMPKDSLAIVLLGEDKVWKSARVKSYKVPSDGSGWVAYHLEKPIEPASKAKATAPDNKQLTDSLTRIIDSLQLVIQSSARKKGKRNDDEFIVDAEGDEASPAITEAGTNLVLRKLSTGEEKVYGNVLEYYFNKKGNKLLIKISRKPKDSLSKSLVLLHDLRKGYADTLSRGGNEFKNFTLSEDGSQVAYIAERDAKPKDLQKFYKIWYFREGMDSANLLVDKNVVGMKLGMTISEFGDLSFSKTGSRLFFGTAPIQPPRDTSLVDIDLVKLDIWHYNDDYLQTQQLFRLQSALQENFLAVYLFDEQEVRQLGSKELPVVYQTNEGDGEQFIGITDFGKRIESQWTGDTNKDIYVMNISKGTKKLVKKDMDGVITPAYVSPGGKYIVWYESKAKSYFVFTGDSVRNISSKIKVPLWDEEHDSPSYPSPYGVMGWHEGDSAVYVYDKYDVWKLSVNENKPPINISQGIGRKDNVTFRSFVRNPEKRFYTYSDKPYFRKFDNKTKSSALAEIGVNGQAYTDIKFKSNDFEIANFITEKDITDNDEMIFTKESYSSSPDLYVCLLPQSSGSLENSATRSYVNAEERKLSSINPQQANYNWGTAELYKWKAFNGKMSEGVLYKPEDFDPTRKYPLILYFYETHSNTLYDYVPPTPTGSRLNISFFVSRGYIVFSPDIHYTTGKPAKSAYDYVVSAAKDLAQKKWIDARNIGIQGQSWGGIQVAQLVTMTDMFKAAWAGAPVANMTSAYGGIRWTSGVNRQFQYEKTQSRIGATLWEKPELYIENSPLFHLPKVKTPLVIMSNDADGAVPWYQGIELFTAMRRLGKTVWLLNYNGEAHNLVERKNKKDIQIREQQYFDWLLKGEKAPKWITEGVPAVKKGKDWGLELAN
jgi:dienelactone hydrolase